MKKGGAPAPAQAITEVKLESAVPELPQYGFGKFEYKD